MDHYFNSRLGITNGITFRYQPQNLLVTTNTPGPSEPTAEQLQFQVALTADELLMLYEDGVIIRTPQFPQGYYLQSPGSTERGRANLSS
jgi:hypothetical protein